MTLLSKKISFVLLFILIISCSGTKNNVELTIINKEVYSLPFDDSIFQRPLELQKEFKKKSLNKIKYKLVNNTDNTLYLVEKKHNLSNYLNLYGLTLESINILDVNNSKMRIGNSFTEQTNNNFLSEKYGDTLKYEFYEKLDYKNKTSYWKDVNFYITKNIIKIYPKEEIYFETYIMLPQTWNSHIGDFSSIYIKKEATYKFQLNFQFMKKEEVLKYLTDSQLKNIKENNYKIFEGELKSQKIPVKFID